MTRAMRTLFCTAALLVLVGVIAFNAANLWEAFGSGPPYFSRTTNMDKWANPLPTLITVDSVAVLLGVGCVYVLRSKRKL
jgi:hypothetical protein